MLVSLHVKNLALIDETEVFFGQGLNILTGETGAGKSIIIGSVNLALGAKADKELIRKGSDYALIELIFQVSEEQNNQIEEMGFSTEEDGSLVIQRRIQPARSLCRVNGETVNTRQLKELSELLIDIHGQHEHQSLLNRKKHLEILDEFCGPDLSSCKAKLKKEYQQLDQLSRQLKALNMDEETRRKEAALAEFEMTEIENAQLKPGEDEAVERDYRKMANSKKIMETLGQAFFCCGYEQEEGAGSQVARALREVKSVLPYDEALTPIQLQLADIDGLMADLEHSFRDYMSEMQFDGKVFADTEERLNTLNHLKTKYRKSIEEIIDYGCELRKKVEQLTDYEASMDNLRRSFETQEEKTAALCRKLSAMRGKSAKLLSKQMREALIDLNFLEVKFEIEVRPSQDKMGPEGWDEVEFMISTNPGEPLKPLGSIASGGELSRVMLALKTVLARKDRIDTLIFDEIDAGISGKTAWKVSEKLGILGKSHQIICITHLPQIAAMADNHFLIEKYTDKKVTVTTIREIREEDSINELARLLGSETITDAVLINARELKEMAGKTKES